MKGGWNITRSTFLGMCSSRENPSKEATITSSKGEGVLSDGEDGKDGELEAGLGSLWPPSLSGWPTRACCGKGKLPFGRLKPFPRDLLPLFLRELDGPGMVTKS
jgi:hypothetical protein